MNAPLNNKLDFPPPKSPEEETPEGKVLKRIDQLEMVAFERGDESSIMELGAARSAIHNRNMSAPEAAAALSRDIDYLNTIEKEIREKPLPAAQTMRGDTNAPLKPFVGMGPAEFRAQQAAPYEGPDIPIIREEIVVPAVRMGANVGVTQDLRNAARNRLREGVQAVVKIIPKKVEKIPTEADIHAQLDAANAVNAPVDAGDSSRWTGVEAKETLADSAIGEPVLRTPPQDIPVPEPIPAPAPVREADVAAVIIHENNPTPADARPESLQEGLLRRFRRSKPEVTTALVADDPTAIPATWAGHGEIPTAPKVEPAPAPAPLKDLRDTGELPQVGGMSPRAFRASQALPAESPIGAMPMGSITPEPIPPMPAETTPELRVSWSPTMPALRVVNKKIESNTSESAPSTPKPTAPRVPKVVVGSRGVSLKNRAPNVVPKPEDAIGARTERGSDQFFANMVGSTRSRSEVIGGALAKLGVGIKDSLINTAFGIGGDLKSLGKAALSPIESAKKIGRGTKSGIESAKNYAKYFQERREAGDSRWKIVGMDAAALVEGYNKLPMHRKLEVTAALVVGAAATGAAGLGGLSFALTKTMLGQRLLAGAGFGINRGKSDLVAEQSKAVKIGYGAAAGVAYAGLTFFAGRTATEYLQGWFGEIFGHHATPSTVAEQQVAVPKAATLPKVAPSKPHLISTAQAATAHPAPLPKPTGGSFKLPPPDSTQFHGGSGSGNPPINLANGLPHDTVAYHAPEAQAGGVASATPAPATHLEAFSNKVEAGDGGIKGIEHFKDALLKKGFTADSSPAIKHILEGDPTKLAKEYGFYKPDINGTGLESARISADSAFGVNEHGDIVFKQHPSSTPEVLAKGNPLDVKFDHHAKIAEVKARLAVHAKGGPESSALNASEAARLKAGVPVAQWDYSASHSIETPPTSVSDLSHVGAQDHRYHESAIVPTAPPASVEHLAERLGAVKSPIEARALIDTQIQQSGISPQLVAEAIRAAPKMSPDPSLMAYIEPNTGAIPGPAVFLGHDGHLTVYGAAAEGNNYDTQLDIAKKFAKFSGKPVNVLLPDGAKGHSIVSPNGSITKEVGGILRRYAPPQSLRDSVYVFPR